MAVACGTPTPRTPRLVHALPGPTPTSTPTAPVRMRCSAVEYDAQPPTITGMSNAGMNSLRLSGSTLDDTCSPETTVPWITRMSSPASSTRWAYFSTRCGGSGALDNDAAALDPLDPPADQLLLDRLGVELLH